VVARARFVALLALLLALLAVVAWRAARAGAERERDAKLARTANLEAAESSAEPAAELAAATRGYRTDDRAVDAPAREARASEHETVAGRIEVAGGIPVGDEPVVVARAHRLGVSRLHSPRIEAHAARDGSFELDVPAGTSSVGLDLDSLVLVLPDEVEVHPGCRDVVLRPDVLAAVRGTVVLREPPSDPSLLEAIRVWCTDAGTQADRSGRFVLPAVPVGIELRVVAIMSGGDGSSGEARVGPLRTGEIRDVQLLLASPAPPEPDAILRGVVVDADGVPIEGAEVSLSPEFSMPDPVSRFHSTSAGRFESAPLAAGLWSLEAQARGRDSAHLSLQLPEDGHDELRIVLGTPPVVRGRVTRPDGTPGAGALVMEIKGRWKERALGGTGSLFVATEPKATRADDDGRFTLTLASGVTRLAAAAEGLAPSAPRRVELAPGAQLDGLELVLRESCRLRGSVVARGDAGECRLLFEAQDGTSVDLWTDRQGNFSCDQLPPGPARLSIVDFASGSVDVVEFELTPEAETTVELRLKRPQ